MSEEINLDLNKASGAEALTPAARRLHRAVLLGFADTGGAPSRASLIRLARDHDVDPDRALTELAELDVVAFDNTGEIRAAYPFSPIPTAIQVSWDGGPTVYAMCAIDALGVSAMLDRPVTIIAAEPGTGAAVTVEVDRHQARWSPESAVVFAGSTDDPCCPSVDSTCGYINFFTTPDSARAWATAHRELRGVRLDQHEALTQAVQEFGALLRDDESLRRETT